MTLRISRRTAEQIKLESHLPSEIFKLQSELRKEGYTFSPLDTYMDNESQYVQGSIGTKAGSWVTDEEG